jgi:hypothetical protein
MFSPRLWRLSWGQSISTVVIAVQWILFFDGMVQRFSLFPKNLERFLFSHPFSASTTLSVLSIGAPSLFSGTAPPRTRKISWIAAPWEGP